jgi:hypothetical protein
VVFVFVRLFVSFVCARNEFSLPKL